MIKTLSEGLSLSLKKILPVGLYNWHKINFSDTLKEIKYKFEQLLWFKLSDSPGEQVNFISKLNNYNLSFIDKIEKDIQLLKYDLIVDYSSKLKNQIKIHFNIDIDDSFKQNINHENLYVKLLESFGLEEVDIVDEKVRSLMFFDGNKESIEEYLKTNFSSDKENESNYHSDLTTAVGSIIFATLTQNEKLKNINGASNNSRSWVHSSQNEKGKKRIGKNAELFVYSTLVKVYGIESVKWVSGNSATPDKNDKLHYDIEYKNDQGEWKYLEVKAFSDNKFIISNSEIEKGLSEPNNYEIALVNETNISIVKDLFKFKEGETFDNNSIFLANAKDYIISHFQIEQYIENLNIE